MATVKQPEQPQIKEKRFSLSKEDRMKVENIESVMGILNLLREGMKNSHTLALMQVRVRLNIKDSDAPKGYMRDVGYDSNSAELVVRDIPVPPGSDSKEN